MIRILSHLWQGLGSIHLTIALCLLLTTDLVYGYFRLDRHTPLFTALNDVGLTTWIATYGRYNLPHTGWFFLLLGLLTLLACNTFVCTTNRVIQLLGAKNPRGRQRLLLKLAPHLMHYALIIILTGYLCSYLFTQVLTGSTLVPGAHLSLPGTKGQVTFAAFDPVYYQGDRLSFLKNEVITPNARLRLSDGQSSREVTLNCNRPVRFQGYSLYLRDFAPKSQGGMNMKTRIDLHIRKDPGVGLYLTGMVLFTLGLALYVYEWIFFKEASK